MEKLIEVLKNKFSDIYIYSGYGGLFCKFNKDVMSMSILTNTDSWMIRYAPTVLFERLSNAEHQIVLSKDIQSVIDWFSNDENIIKIYEESLRDSLEYYLQHPVLFPPCQDCNTKMDEIRRAYDKLKNQESSDEDVLDKIEAEIEALFKWYPFTKGGAYIRKDDVKNIINKYKSEGEVQK